MTSLLMQMALKYRPMVTLHMTIRARANQGGLQSSSLRSYTLLYALTGSGSFFAAHVMEVHQELCNQIS